MHRATRDRADIARVACAVDTRFAAPDNFMRCDLVKYFTKSRRLMERTYLPVLLLLGFVVAERGADPRALPPHPPRRGRPPVKQTPYESGMPPLGDARERFSVKFYMVAMLFIIFDIETVFMIPWGAHFRQLSCAVRRSSAARARRASCRSSACGEMLVFIVDPARRVRLRVEEGSAAMGLTPRPRRRRASTVDPQSQEGWVTTRLDFLVNWGRANSLWPMPFGTACCAIEFMATAASKFDLARFGMERMSFSPRQADVLICAGRVPFKLAPVHPAHLAADAAAQVVHLDGRVRVDGRHVRQLRRGAGDRHDHPGRRLRAGLPAASRRADVRHHDAPGEGQARAHGATSRCATRWSPIRRASSTSRRR